jgi:hypothetical protein
MLLYLTGAAAYGQITIIAPILSEFLPNQTGVLETEWIELYNPISSPVDLSRFSIGDALGLKDISDTTLLLDPGEYIVLADDAAKFLDYYIEFDGRVLSPNGWQILNNSGGDVVRLADTNDVIIDSVYYESGFADNRSWERYISADGVSYWGESFDPSGSTPGESNSYFYPRAASIELTVSPDPFSPDGDGFEDVTMIRYNPPEAETFELSVYDISGRRVKTFFESGLSIPGAVQWDGTGDNGRTLPVGIYILYARTEGRTMTETKKTIVIAR